MKRVKKPRMDKLSESMPETSLANTGKKAVALRQLTKKSGAIADGISQIINSLRQVRAPGWTTACIFAGIEANKTFIQNAFYNSADIIFREFTAGSGLKVIMCYIDELVNKEFLSRTAIQPFIANAAAIQPGDKPTPETIKKLIAAASLQEVRTMSAVIGQLVNGNAVMFVDGVDTAFAVAANGFDYRQVTEPDVEAVIRGPREGFIENVRTNIALVRRKIKNPSLVFEQFILGAQTNTSVHIGYINGIVNQAALKEVKRRLSKINTDAILESGYIEQFIEDSPFSPLATVGNSQKPDIVAAKLLEGRVAIFCDGTPHVLTVPHFFIEALQASEDYYMRPFQASLLRLIRIASLLIGTLAPGVYVALQTYHQEMIPTVLLLRIAGSMEGVPFPALVETFLMVLFYELLRESGTRLPRAVGSAVSIVGALIIGESAVNAGLVSAPVVIVIAIAGVASFIVPALTEVMTLYRLFFLLLGGVMGLYGIACGVLMAVAHAVSLRSFGVPYTSPMAPLNKSVLTDFILRFPLWALKLRPAFLAKNNRKRQGSTRGK